MSQSFSQSSSKKRLLLQNDFVTLFTMFPRIIKAIIVTLVVIGSTLLFFSAPAKPISASLDEESVHQKFVPNPSCHSFSLESCGPINLSGTASGSTPLMVFLVDQYPGAPTDFVSLSEALYRNDEGGVTMRTVLVSNGHWSVEFLASAGNYNVFVFDKTTHTLLLSSSITRQ